MNGDAWRWQIEYHGWRPLRTIQVIEPELDPLTWDGDDG